MEYRRKKKKKRKGRQIKKQDKDQPMGADKPEAKHVGWTLSRKQIETHQNVLLHACR